MRSARCAFAAVLLSFCCGLSVGVLLLPATQRSCAAMDKKARSKQMNHIVERLLRYDEFDVVVFGDETILNQSVEEWPLCDCLLCWHSGEIWLPTRKLPPRFPPTYTVPKVDIATPSCRWLPPEEGTAVCDAAQTIPSERRDGTGHAAG